MGRPAPTPENAVVETWEIAFEGSVWVWVYDRREDRYRKQAVGRRSGSKTLHITRDDRQYNQERIPDENKALDPFINGQLRLLGAATRDESLDVRNHFSEPDLIAMFEVRDPELFREALETLTSEVVLRRLQSLADIHASVVQRDILREVTDARYPIGGTQKTVREMIEAGERIGAVRI
jgi:hypothetical protein